MFAAAPEEPLRPLWDHEEPQRFRLVRDEDVQHVIDATSEVTGPEAFPPESHALKEHVQLREATDAPRPAHEGPGLRAVPPQPTSVFEANTAAFSSEKLSGRPDDGHGPRIRDDHSVRAAGQGAMKVTSGVLHADRVDREIPGVPQEVVDRARLRIESAAQKEWETNLPQEGAYSDKGTPTPADSHLFGLDQSSGRHAAVRGSDNYRRLATAAKNAEPRRPRHMAGQPRHMAVQTEEVVSQEPRRRPWHRLVDAYHTGREAFGRSRVRVAGAAAAAVAGLVLAPVAVASMVIPRGEAPEQGSPSPTENPFTTQPPVTEVPTTAPPTAPVELLPAEAGYHQMQEEENLPPNA